MWYLTAAIIGSSSLVVLLKIFGLRGVNLTLGITINYIAGAILAFLFARQLPTVHYMLHAEWLWAAVVVGILFTLSFVVYALSAQRSGVAVTTISGRAAVVIPVVFAFLVLDAEVTWLKIAMLVLILLAMVLILKKDKAHPQPDISSGSAGWLLLLPLAVFLFNGINDTLVQFAQGRLVPDGDYPAFVGVMFVASAITGLICYLVNSAKAPHRPNSRDLLWGTVLGIMNWICMIGVFNGLDYVDGSIFYPLYYTGAIILSTIAGVWAFREKLSPVNYLGIAIAVVAIAVLSTQ